MNYIIVTGLIIAGVVLLDVLSKYRSNNWKNEAHELFSAIYSELCDPVTLDDIRRARNFCESGRRRMHTDDDSVDRDARIITELGLAAGILLLFCILGWVHNDDIAQARKESSSKAQQEQVQPSAVQEPPCTEQK